MATLTLIRGDSFPVSVTFGDTLDLTGWEWAITVKHSVLDTDADAILSMGPTAVSAAEITATEFSHVFPAAETDSISPGFYVLDIQFTVPAGALDSLPDGGVVSVPQQTVSVTADVTRRTE